MNILTNPAEECNVILSASINNTASAASAHSPESISNGGGDEETQLNEADKPHARNHALSRLVAKQHGFNHAAVLTGFAIKLRRHKRNKWKDRYWYYDPFSALVKVRWPYFSESALGEYIDYLADDAKLLIVDCNNKESYDRTNWYAMEDVVQTTALADLIWYDVRVAKLLGIRAGLLYNNIRYHVGLALEKNLGETPYHKLNQARLARDLGMEISTVKDLVSQLISLGLITKHPTKKKLYTICDLNELAEIVGNLTAIDGNLTANNKKQIVGNLGAIVGNLTSIGGNLTAIVGNLGDNTQCETNEKPFTNQLQNSRCVFVEQIPGDKKTGINHGLGHQILNNTVASAPVPGKEHTDTLKNCPFTYEDILAHNKQLNMNIDKWDESVQYTFKYSFIAVLHDFTHEFMSLDTIHAFSKIKDAHILVQHLHLPVHELLQKNIKWLSSLLNQPDTEISVIYYFPMMEALVHGFLYTTVKDDARWHSIELLDPSIFEAYVALSDRLEDATTFTAEEKLRLFNESVVWHNKAGWDVGKGALECNLVPLTKPGSKAILALFHQHPELAPTHLLDVLYNCLLVSKKRTPDGFDSNWHARQGTNLVNLAKWIEVIVQELDMFKECPITMEA